jgi:hypothetical protein
LLLLSPNFSPSKEDAKVVRRIIKISLMAIGSVLSLATIFVVFVSFPFLYLGLVGAVHRAVWWQPISRVQVYDVDLNKNHGHFLGGQTALRSRLRRSLLPWVSVTVIVRPDGTVADAWTESTYSMARYVDVLLSGDATTVARSWTFVPFKHAGVPVYAKLTHVSLRVYPPERRPSNPAPFPDVRDWRSVTIRLERTRCYGTCPAYSVEIHGDGSVVYEGHFYVEATGVHTTNVSPAAVRALVGKFRRADFFHLYPDYHSMWTDNPTFTLSLGFDGRTMCVVDYLGQDDGMPSVVKELEDEVDNVSGASRWVGTNG